MTKQPKRKLRVVQFKPRRRPADRDAVMHRTRATVCFVNARQSEALKLRAFLELFHPELTDEQKRALVMEHRR